MQALRIGINALFRGKPTGVATYIINLVNHIISIDQINEYYIIVAESNRKFFDFTKENTHEVLCSVDTARPTLRRAWEQIQLPSIVNDHKLDILHCPMNIVPFIVRCKCIATFLDCQYFHPSSKNTLARRYYHKLFMRLTLSKSNGIITISRSMKEEIINYLGGNKEKIRVIYLGQDFSESAKNGTVREKIRKNHGLNNRYLLFVGFPHYRKNLRRLIKAFAISLKTVNEPCELVICGDLDTEIESDYSNLLRTSEESGIRKNVKFINYLDKGELMDLVSCAEAFVFPTLYEGFGIPVIEAMACGTPVLVSDIPVMHEIVGDSGLYFNPYDSLDISRCLSRALTDANLMERLAVVGKKAAAEFTWEQTAKKNPEILFRNSLT